MWESTRTVGRFFYGRVVADYPWNLFGKSYTVVRARNFKQPIAIDSKRVKLLANKNIDTAPRPVLA